jgi:hypothetical protein
MDYEKSENFLKQNNIRTEVGCLNYCIDELDNKYHIPNFCINDPYFEKEILNEKPLDQNKKINVNLYDLYENKTMSLKLPIIIKGIEIKKLYCEITHIQISDFKIRIFFGGAEIIDDQFLYQHKLQDGFTIQLIRNKLD